jgi:hypothetical protein
MSVSLTKSSSFASTSVYIVLYSDAVSTMMSSSQLESQQGTTRESSKLLLLPHSRTYLLTLTITLNTESVHMRV